MKLLSTFDSLPGPHFIQQVIVNKVLKRSFLKKLTFNIYIRSLREMLISYKFKMPRHLMVIINTNFTTKKIFCKIHV